jgi:IS1 family transposase
MFSMKKLDTQTRVRIANCLLEGVGVNATCRMTGAAKNTVLKMLADLGDVCAEYLDTHVRGIKAKRIQCDEIWSFCHSKEKNVPEEHKGEFGYGSVWTWTAIDSESKLMVSYLVGLRDAPSAQAFIDDLAGRIHGVPQITTDGLKLYVDAIADSFGEFVDYAMLVKMYGAGPDPNASASARYSPAECIGCKKDRISGEPDMKHVSTSHVERANLTIRMMNRRFTRLTNAFSKKIENHIHAFSLYAFHYNYVRIHQTLRVTPAMAAGISDHVWSLEEMVGLLEEHERKMIEAGGMKRGKYRPRTPKISD